MHKTTLLYQNVLEEENQSHQHGFPVLEELWRELLEAESCFFGGSDTPWETEDRKVSNTTEALHNFF